MKKALSGTLAALVLLCLFLSSAGADAALDANTFQDARFREALVEMNIDTDGNGKLSGKELAAVTRLDLSRNPKLNYLHACDNQIASIDISSCPKLVSHYQNNEAGRDNGTRKIYGQDDKGDPYIRVDLTTEIIAE